MISVLYLSAFVMIDISLTITSFQEYSLLVWGVFFTEITKLCKDFREYNCSRHAKSM